MNRTAVVFLLSTATIAAFLSSCSSTQIVNEWQMEGVEGKPFKKVLVLAIADQEGNRRTMEDEFARQLQSMGVDGVASYIHLPDKGKMMKETVARAVADAAADSALVIRIVKVESKEYVSPGYPPPPENLYGYYDWAWSGFYEPPTVYSYEVVRIETKLFDAKAKDLVWDLCTESVYPSDFRKGMAELAELVLNKARQRGWL